MEDLTERPCKSDLEWFDGRWQHSSPDFGLFTVYEDVALFDRGTGLRIRCGEDGTPWIRGFFLSRELSTADHIIWISPDTSITDLTRKGWLKHGRLLAKDHARGEWQKWHTSTNTIGWMRPNPARKEVISRFVRCAPGEPVGFPERVSMFAVPPPSMMPVDMRPLRLLVYGGCLTIGWPSGDNYARSLVDELGELNIFVEVIGCGVSAHTSDKLVANMWSKSLIDKMGLRGEGILRLFKRQGPFDLVLIMVGIADIVRGQVGDDVVQLHKACHKLGARTVAISVPPSWHDNPENFTSHHLEMVKKIDSLHGFVTPESVRAAKVKLNQQLRQLVVPESKANPCGHCAAFVDTSQLLPCSSKTSDLWETADFIHLTARGSQTLGRGAAQELRPLLQRLSSKAAVWWQDQEKQLAGLSVKSRQRVASRAVASTLPLEVENNAIPGFITNCNDLLKATMTIEEAKAKSASMPECRGFCFIGPPREGPIQIHFKSKWEVVENYNWTSIRCEDVNPPEEEDNVGITWSVVGGVREGGLIVQQGEALDSLCYPLRLAPGATLMELKLCGEGLDRLHYKLLEGKGPAIGWVSIRHAGVTLVKLIDDDLVGIMGVSVDAKRPDSKTDVAPEMSTDRTWRVVGGEGKGGIMVRRGKELNSMAYSVRLGVAALLQELEMSDDRLHYKKLQGVGPESGWVSVSVNGKKLVELENPETGFYYAGEEY